MCLREGLRPDEFWELSWHDCTEYVAIANEKLEEQRYKDEVSWHLTRSLWSAVMNANFKKKGGGEYEPKDLITLALLDKEEETKVEPPSLEVFDKLAAKHGKRRKNGIK